MNFKERMAPHLPFLRRYARALTGSQGSGDAYVRACLEAILSDRDLVNEDLAPRVGLFRVFHAIWDSATEFDDGTDIPSIGLKLTTAESRLASLAPRNRRALLLTAMEGFTLAEAAQILSSDIETVEELIASAQREIERELKTSIVIIEDESVIALHLESLVAELGHHVIGIAATHKDAVEAVRREPPGLILADIQLADNSSGIDAVKEILAEHDVPVIFITAYPERLLTGARPEPTYLVTKPFMPETVKAAIGQALFFHPRREKAA